MQFVTKLHWLCQLDHKILKLSRAVGCGLAVQVKNVMIFHALVLDTVKMTHSVILKLLSYFSYKFNCTFPKQNWTLELALPPNGNVRELFFIASLKSDCFPPDFTLSGKSQTIKRKHFFFSPAASGFVLATGSPFLLMLFPSTGSLGRVRILNATPNTEAMIVSSAVSKHDIALEVS